MPSSEHIDLLNDHQLVENEHCIISEMLLTSLHIKWIQNVVITILRKLAWDLKVQQAPDGVEKRKAILRKVVLMASEESCLKNLQTVDPHIGNS